MIIVLLGYMGSGKSAVGKRLAEVLSFQFVDLDMIIEAKEGASISKIFEDKGEIYFRKIEAKCLREITTIKDDIVLALGGGTPCYANSMDYLKSHSDKIKTIYLNPSLQILTSRLFKEKKSRPLISHLNSENELEDFIRKHLFERAFYYNQAVLSIPITDESVNEVAEKIILELL